MAQKVKNLLKLQETWASSLDWEESPGEGNDNPLQFSCLENSMYKGAWRAIVYGVTKSQTQLNDLYFRQTEGGWGRGDL